MSNDLESIEAVYYSGQVPSSLASLTLLGCVFDRVYFPGVYLPYSFDEVATLEQLRRFRDHKIRNLDDLQVMRCLQFVLHRHHVSDWCIFTGTDADVTGALEPGTDDVAKALEEAIFGPPPPNFFPAWPQGFAQGIPGGCIRAPASITYPSSALLFATRKGLPLINDDPSLPVPGLGNGSARDNAKLLATVLALECVRLVLPNVPVLTPEGVAEMRNEAKDLVRPFRISLLKLARELNAMLTSSTPMKEVQRAATFLSETTVHPELHELRQSIESQGQPWHKRAIGVFKDVPSLTSAFFTMPTNIAIAKVLAKLGEVLTDLRDEELERNHAMKRSGFYYLLKLPEVIVKSDL